MNDGEPSPVLLVGDLSCSLDSHQGHRSPVTLHWHFGRTAEIKKCRDMFRNCRTVSRRVCLFFYDRSHETEKSIGGFCDIQNNQWRSKCNQTRLKTVT